MCRPRPTSFTATCRALCAGALLVQTVCTAVAALADPDGTWSEVVAPAARFGASAAYDPVRDRLLVFAGDTDVFSSGGLMSDVWALSLGANAQWTRIETAGPVPPPRTSASMVYDPLGDRLIVSGGYGLAYLEDLWALSLDGAPTWTALTPTGTAPTQRVGQSAVYDPTRDQMIVFGGFGPTGYLSDTYTLTLSDVPAWTRVSAGGPPLPRTGHAAIYDPTRDRMVIFAGYNGSNYTDTYLNDVWAFSSATSSWSKVFTTPGIHPRIRQQHVACYDPVRDALVVFGGSTPPDACDLDDTWALSLGVPLATWTQLAPSGSVPRSRENAECIHDPLRDRLLLFGGYHYQACGVSQDTTNVELGDVWALDLSTGTSWSRLAEAGTIPGTWSNHALVADSLGQRLISFGGMHDGVLSNDAWQLTLTGAPFWTLMQPIGAPPSPRSGHTAILDPPRNRLIVFGGHDSAYLNDTWFLDLGDTPHWNVATPLGTPPPPRSEHSAIYDPVGDRMIVFGGAGRDGLDDGRYDDAWSLVLGDTPTWTQISPPGAGPAARSSHAAVYADGAMVVFGGRVGPGCCGALSDVWSLALAENPAWTQLHPSGEVNPAFDHVAVFDPIRHRMLAILEDDPTVWSLSLTGSPAWVALSTSGDAISGRQAAAAAFAPWLDEMFVLGGYDLGDTWALSFPQMTGVAGPPVLARERIALRIAPNPVRDHAVLTYAVVPPTLVTLTITDARGRIVWSRADPHGTGSIAWSDRVAALPGGVYVLTASDAAGHGAARRFVRLP